MDQQPANPSGPERVAALLMAFGATPDHEGGHSVSELARVVGRERSQVSRMLKALARTGAIEQDPEQRTYRLGWPLQVLASGAGDQLLLRAARPVLRFLVARTGEVALLSVQQGNRSLTVAREDSQQSLRAGGWVGRSSPMHCSASGRALMFDSSPDLVEALTRHDLAAVAPGPLAPRTIAELSERLVSERNRAYATAIEEVEVGLASVSTPVRGPLGEIVAVLNVSGPTSRLADRVDEVTQVLLPAAASLSGLIARRATRSEVPQVSVQETPPA